MPTIDLHTHILPPPDAWPDLSTKYGYAGWIALEAIERGARMVRVEQDPARRGHARVLPDGKQAKTFFRQVEANVWDPAVRLAEMNTHGVDAQVLSTVPVMFSYWARQRDTLDVSRWLNDHLAGIVAAHPDRFVGLGTVPLNAPDLAVKELERCVRDLGMAGVQIGTNVRGVDLGDDSLREFFGAAEKLGACVFVHPWEMLQGCDATTSPKQIDSAPSPHPVPPRLNANWMAWLIGMPAETGLAVCSVLFSGLLDRFPKLRIGFAHGGGCFPGCIGRIDHGFHARPDLCQTHTKTSPREYLRSSSHGSQATPARFFADTLVHDRDALEHLIRLLGPERVALGSDYPFPLGEERPGSLIDSVPSLSAPDRERLLFRSALEFLGPAAGRLACAKA